MSEVGDIDNHRTPFLGPGPEYDAQSDSSPPFTSPTKSTSSRSQIISQDTKELMAIGLLPTLNVLVTAVLTGVLMYVYQEADKKPIDYTMGGMTIPALVALIMTLLKMCLVGGIGYAVSEYKWVRLQQGSKLSLLEVYNACTRGVGGMVGVFFGIRPDRVLVPTILFQLGLIAMGPASQQILTTYPWSTCDPAAAKLLFTDVASNLIANIRGPSYDIRLMSGITSNYLVEYGFYAAAYNSSVSINLQCPDKSANCTFNDIPILHATVECQPASFQNVSIISERNLNATTLLTDYYNLSDPNANIYTPKFFYAGSMLGRTYYDIANRTASEAAAPTGPPDPATLRPYVGDQTFVVLSDKGIAWPSVYVAEKDIVVEECTLESHVNQTTFAILGTDWQFTTHSSEAVTMDYDLLANSSYWAAQPSGSDISMLNAYGMQISLLYYLIEGISPGGMNDLAGQWSAHADKDDTNTIHNFLNDLLYHADLLVMLGRPASMTPAAGNACYEFPTSFHLKASAYYPVSLVMMIPMVWWVITWLLSLQKMGGVSRGNSQVALLVTGFTSAVRRRFKGFSHADQNTLFKQAKKVDIAFGETQSDGIRRGHVAFGVPGELNPIRARRRSLPRI